LQTPPIFFFFCILFFEKKLILVSIGVLCKTVRKTASIIKCSRNPFVIWTTENSRICYLQINRKMFRLSLQSIFCLLGSSCLRKCWPATSAWSLLIALEGQAGNTAVGRASEDSSAAAPNVHGYLSEASVYLWWWTARTNIFIPFLYVMKHSYSIWQFTEMDCNHMIRIALTCHFVTAP